MQLISWNVNGLRAVLKKGFLDFLDRSDADIICLQEIKAQREQVEETFPDYFDYWYSAERKGYSGVLTLTKKEPLSVRYGIGSEVFDREGRTITCEFETFYLVNVYTPNAKSGLERLGERMEFEDAFFSYLEGLKQTKAVIVCGDLNVAHKDIDLKNPKQNRGSAGFTDEERSKFERLISNGWIDTFRHFYPDQTDAYTWWSMVTRARSRNAGWRIDYFLASEDLRENLKDAKILSEVEGSDHCPVQLELHTL